MAQSLLKSTTKVSLMTSISRVAGFLRDVVFAHYFGAGASLDAFLIAFKIPNFMRRLFAEGAFSQVFVPVLSDYRARADQDSVKVFVDKVSGALSVVLIGVVALGILGAPFVVRLFAPGFQVTDPRFELTVSLLRLTFPYLLLISLTAFASGIQNTYRQFAVPAITPVFLNVSLIALALMSGSFEEPIMALGWGVLLAGVLQLGFQMPFLRFLGLLPIPRWDWRDSGVKRLLRLMGPAILGASVMQINLLIDTLFASFLPVGSLTWLYYSDRLLEFPIGVFGVALATVVLPHLSQDFVLEAHQPFSERIDWSLRWILLIGLPAAVGLVLLAEPLLAALFQYGHFGEQDRIMTARSLMALSLGLVSFLAIKVLISAFYARQNTIFPVKIAILAIGINVIGNSLLIGPLAHAGLALASTISSVIQCGILLGVLCKQKIYLPAPGWASLLGRLALANSAMAFFLWWGTPSVETWVTWVSWKRMIILMSLILGGALIYFSSLWLSGMRVSQLRLENAK